MGIERLQEVIVLDQLWNPDTLLYSHVENITSVHKFIEEGVSAIPPGIGESFVQAGIQNVDVITGFDKEYQDYYGTSIRSINETAFPAIVENTHVLLEELLWKLNVNRTVEVDETYLEQLLLCFVVNGTCAVIEQELSLKQNIITDQLCISSIS